MGRLSGSPSPFKWPSRAWLSPPKSEQVRGLPSSDRRRMRGQSDDRQGSARQLGTRPPGRRQRPRGSPAAPRSRLPRNSPTPSCCGKPASPTSPRRSFAAAVQSTPELEQRRPHPADTIGRCPGSAAPAQARVLPSASRSRSCTLRCSMPCHILTSGDSFGKPRQRLGRKDVPQVDAIPRTTHKGARILLAEDNEINQQVALEVLAHAGYQCDTVSDGQAGRRGHQGHVL